MSTAAVNLGSIFASLEFRTDGLTAGVRQAKSELRGLESKLDGVAGTSMRVGTALKAGVAAGLLGVGVAAVKVGRDAVSMAGDFERAMNVLQASSSATAKQMEEMSALARKLGADAKLPATSSLDAAEAMLELNKAGLSVKDTMVAARGTLQLAAVAGLKAADAARINANALNTFKLKGTEATTVADLLAASSMAASGEVTDMAAALQQAGAVAASSKISIKDTATSIALLAKNGILGSDAGTSLKTAIIALTAPTDEARKVMKALGIEIYDAQGQMRPWRDIIGQVSRAVNGLTQEQRDWAMKTIFGTDALRTANIVLAGGVEQFDEMAKATGRSGAAAELAEAKTKGYKGAVEALDSAWESFLEKRGAGVLNFFTELVKGATDGLTKLDELADRIKEINSLEPPKNPTIVDRLLQDNPAYKLWKASQGGGKRWAGTDGKIIHESMPSPSGARGKLAGLAPEFASRLQSLIAASGGKIGIGSGLRSTAEQAALYARYKAGKGPLAARPGHSKHERGLAADLTGDLDLAAKLAPQFGLHFPVRGERWHVEMAGGKGNANIADLMNGGGKDAKKAQRLAEEAKESRLRAAILKAERAANLTGNQIGDLTTEFGNLKGEDAGKLAGLKARLSKLIERRHRQEEVHIQREFEAATDLEKSTGEAGLNKQIALDNAAAEKKRALTELESKAIQISAEQKKKQAEEEAKWHEDLRQAAAAYQNARSEELALAIQALEREREEARQHLGEGARTQALTAEIFRLRRAQLDRERAAALKSAGEKDMGARADINNRFDGKRDALFAEEAAAHRESRDKIMQQEDEMQQYLLDANMIGLEQFRAHWEARRALVAEGSEAWIEASRKILEIDERIFNLQQGINEEIQKRKRAFEEFGDDLTNEAGGLLRDAARDAKKDAKKNPFKWISDGMRDAVVVSIQHWNSFKGFWKSLLQSLKDLFLKFIAEKVAAWIAAQVTMQKAAAATGAAGAAGGGGLGFGGIGGFLKGKGLFGGSIAQNLGWVGLGLTVNNMLGNPLGKIWKGITNPFKKIFRFAEGGKLPTGVPSLVGEAGPELIVPRTPQMALPANIVQKMGGGTQINVHVNTGPVNSAVDLHRTAQEVAWLISQRRPLARAGA